MPHLPTEPVASLQNIKGIDFPAEMAFRQILVTGPPGSGKSTLITRIGGWSEEGYLDLAKKFWWRSEILSVRPREIHIGMPFLGLDDAVTVFDAEFYNRDPVPDIDYDRIRVPPRKRYFFEIDYYRRYVFEFLLPSAETVYQRRVQRARRNTHLVDKQLSLEICVVQYEAFLRLAEFLHQKGFSVYLRETTESPPMLFVDPPAQP